jgi:hypothetical protein
MLRPYVLPLLAACLFATPSLRAAEASCVQISDSLPQIEPSDDPRLVLDADRVDLDVEGRSELQGSVRLRYGDREFSTERLGYDERTRSVDVPASSTFRSRELTTRSESERIVSSISMDKPDASTAPSSYCPGARRAAIRTASASRPTAPHDSMARATRPVRRAPTPGIWRPARSSSITKRA